MMTPKTKLARDAVMTAAALISNPWYISKTPSGIQPITTAATEAKNPTTIA